MISFQAIIEYASTKTLKPMTKLLLVSVLIFGGLTIAFRDETFILWKPTIVNWALGLLLAGSQFLLRRPVLGSLMGTQIQLPDPVWFKLGYGWAIGFFIAWMCEFGRCFSIQSRFLDDLQINRWSRADRLSTSLSPWYISIARVFLSNNRSRSREISDSDDAPASSTDRLKTMGHSCDCLRQASSHD